MALRRRVIITVHCDHCGTDYGWTDFASLAEAIEIVTSSGWLVIGKRGTRALCPECARNPGA